MTYEEKINELMHLLKLKRTEVLDIDVGMFDILIELNKKGWKTTYCCEGHPFVDLPRWSMCIAFEDAYDFPIAPPLFQLNECNKKNKYSEVKSKNGSFYYWNGSKDKKLTYGDQQRERLETLNNILKWARALPIYKEAKFGKPKFIKYECPYCGNEKTVQYEGSIFEKEYWKDDIILEINCEKCHRDFVVNNIIENYGEE